MANGTVSEDDQGKAAVAFPFRVLLGPPVTRTVPIFGLAAHAGRDDHELWSVSDRDDSKTIDRQALGRLRSGKFGEHSYLTTRHKDGPRRALYATWLGFRDEEKAASFQAEFPRYGLSNLLADAEKRIETIQYDLRQGLNKGRFDLKQLEEPMRYSRARLYVLQVDRLHAQNQRISLLLMVGQSC